MVPWFAAMVSPNAQGFIQYILTAAAEMVDYVSLDPHSRLGLLEQPDTSSSSAVSQLVSGACCPELQEIHHH